LEFRAAFADLRRAIQEQLIAPAVLTAESLAALEAAPRGALLEKFEQRHAPIGEIAQETRWWAGFRHNQLDGSGVLPPQPYVAAPKVGRNDVCPCGSGQKYKKCCGK
jgi:uncharacterized protein YecA (UPF0149 family)